MLGFGKPSTTGFFLVMITCYLQCPIEAESVSTSRSPSGNNTSDLQNQTTISSYSATAGKTTTASIIDEPNTIKSIPDSNCPETCSCILSKRTLNISNCSGLAEKQLHDLIAAYPNATRLVIRHSNLEKIPKAVCGLDQLVFLDLAYNIITILEESWTCPKWKTAAGSLKSINLAFNSIADLPLNFSEDLEAIPSLRNLDLNSNLLVTLDAWPLATKNLNINLDRNRIDSFSNWAGLKFNCSVNNGYHIRLRRNMITHLSDMFNGWGISVHDRNCFLNQSSNITVDKNPFNCDCVDYDIFKEFNRVQFAFRLSVICVKPVELYRERVGSISLDKYYCEVKEGCPSQCSSCRKVPYEMAITADCSNRNLTSLPDNLPDLPSEYRYSLNFTGNDIEIFDNKPYLHKIRTGIFTQNDIHYISFNSLTAMKDIHTLHLDKNSLLYLPNGILDVINMTASLRLIIKENAWICDCNALETRRWFLKQGTRVVDRNSILCASPSRVRGRNMLLMKESDFICGDPQQIDYWAYVGVAAATAGAWLVVIFVPLSILYANRLRLWRKYKWHPFNKDECSGEYKEFDVFIAYAEVDNAYAIGQLFADLESRGLSVAYHKVNFIGGKPIKVNIEECIRKSKRTITVLSKRFFDSDWCVVELKSAVEIDTNQRTKRHMAILLEDIGDIPDLEPFVKKFLKSDRCLKLNCEHFDERISYMLARKKVKDQKDLRPGCGATPMKKKQKKKAPTPRIVAAEERGDTPEGAAGERPDRMPPAPTSFDMDGNPVFATDTQPLISPENYI